MGALFLDRDTLQVVGFQNKRLCRKTADRERRKVPYLSALHGRSPQGKDWATALQATSTRLVSAMYAHRFYNDKLTLATEAIYNFNTGAHT